MITSIALAAALMAASVPALAQEAANGRFSMSPTAEGYLKLDSRTGEVTECRRTGDQGYRCTLTPDERSALQAEIDRLAGENAALREAMAAQGVTPPTTEPGPGSPGVVSPGPRPGGTAGPSDQEFDRAMSLMERFMRRFMALMKEEQAKPPTSP